MSGISLRLCLLGTCWSYEEFPIARRCRSLLSAVVISLYERKLRHREDKAKIVRSIR